MTNWSHYNILTQTVSPGQRMADEKKCYKLLRLEASICVIRAPYPLSWPCPIFPSAPEGRLDS